MRRLLKYLIIVVVIGAALYFLLPGSKPIQTDVVRIASGEMTGLINEQTEVASFKGVPFATAPVGNLRWRPPQPAKTWAGVREANKHGPMCTQITGGEDVFIDLMMDGVGLSWWRKLLFGTLVKVLPKGKVSEDCLTLSIYAPADFEKSKSKPRAVMVWYHGGGYRFGSGDTPIYDATKLAQRGVIVVTVNYRLGALGFMAHPELTEESEHSSSGNYATLDQIQALKWVEENIAAFGGDPNRVTIFGESAGGHSVGQVMTSPLSDSLVHRAIGQSGIGTNWTVTLEDGELDGTRLAELFGFTGDGSLEKLRALPAAKIEEMFNDHPALATLAQPLIDGWVFPVSSAAAFDEGSAHQIPMLLGTNADEGTLLAPLIGSPFIDHFPGPTTAEEYKALMREVYSEHAEDLLALYPAITDDDLFDAINSLFGDHFFGMHAWFAGTRHVLNDNPVFLYMFTRTSPSPDQWAGAYHGSDIQFIFGGFFPLFPKNDFDDALSEQMMNYWVRFAKTGDPNAPDWPVWEQLQLEDPQEMELGERVASRPVERQRNYEILVTQVDKLLKANQPEEIVEDVSATPETEDEIPNPSDGE